MINIDDDRIKDMVEGRERSYKVEDSEMLRVYQYYNETLSVDRTRRQMIARDINLLVVKMVRYIKENGIDKYMIRYGDNMMEEFNKRYNLHDFKDVIKYRMEEKEEVKEEEGKIIIERNIIKYNFKRNRLIIMIDFSEIRGNLRFRREKKEKDGKGERRVINMI